MKTSGRLTIEDRFWDKVKKGTNCECWEWEARKTIDGYGRFRLTHTKEVAAHRFSYLLLIGPIPNHLELDHICHNRGCVNPSHLRPCTDSENARNSLINKVNSSGFKGVSWNKGMKKWRSYIQINKRQIHLGFYTTKEKAFTAYCEAALKYHGEFANFGWVA